MRAVSRARFPEASLLAAMVGEHAPVDVRRAVRRLRAEGAPAVAIDNGIAALARGLATSDVSRSPAVLDVLPPLFWIEARAGDAGSAGWVIERKGSGLVVRGFDVAPDPGSVPEPRGTAAVAFDAGVREEEEDIRRVRGLIASIALPEMLSQMGEPSPVLVTPADPSGEDAILLRGFRLSVAIPPDAAPG